ncbi:MAG: hypothetical protein KJ670_16145 [Alphaproteobacteria bacterium]|nr:hypothetical protein [Rhizobiaceae bacterium]MBU3963310.1 hypothetical protein [Alphaproteobacteria bacterium]MBU4052410.1 hypothetical protein [Alphaproteobacteria bacterium]MBU4090242.1 hypothetical protein [Alphaproteobacteria bacterium]MBU4156435.1 hypothetical protein [Alphaproteobacteria bacterium]
MLLLNAREGKNEIGPERIDDRTALRNVWRTTKITPWRHAWAACRPADRALSGVNRDPAFAATQKHFLDFPGRKAHLQVSFHLPATA